MSKGLHKEIEHLLVAAAPTAERLIRKAKDLEAAKKRRRLILWEDQ